MDVKKKNPPRTSHRIFPRHPIHHPPIFYPAFRFYTDSIIFYSICYKRTSATYYRIVKKMG